MKHVPKYLLPRIAPVAGAESTEGSQDVGFVPFKKGSSSRGRGRGRGGRGGSSGRGKKKADPLRKFGR